MGTIFIGLLDDFAIGDRLRQHNTFIIILQTRKDFVGTSVEQTYKSYPFLLVVLKTYYVTLQFCWTLFHYLENVTGVVFVVVHVIIAFKICRKGSENRTHNKIN